MSATDTVRPSPDALLAEAQRHERGRLKIFLGAAPGVGKTYEMLSVARRKLAEGVDVVIGIVETHGRAETEALIQGLPQVPRQHLKYRERELEELDLDAVLQRKPRLALIDELAHTNVPGSRHAKRYQDVQELLDAGIDVYTTLNVQHLESFNDIVGRITGVEVRETVPDAIIEQAHDVELIDLPPDDLIERLRQGKVYVPDAARRALDHYFSRGNLLALRELALRAAAERVDDDMSVFMRAHAIAGPWPARGRLIVCVDATAASEHVIRTAKRLADQRHLPWTAIYVQTLGSAASAHAQLDANLALASQLGADTAILTGDRVGEVIVEYSRTHNAAQIVVGRSMDVRHRFWPRRRLARWLLDRASDFEITIVAATTNGSSGVHALPAERVRKWVTSRDVVLAIGFSAGAAAIGKLLERYTDSASLALIFLLAVTFAGATGGLVASVLCSVVAFMAYNYLFTDPRYSLSVDDPQDVTTLVVFLAVSLVVGQLAARLRRQAHDAWLSTRRVETLFDFSRRLATAVDDRDLLAAAATGLSELLGKRCVVLRSNAQRRADPPVELERAGEFRDTDQAAADWAVSHRETAGRGTGTLPAAAWYFVPIEQSGQVFGVIGVHLPATSDGIDAEQNRLLFTLQTQLAAACERFRLREAAQSARLQKTAESLRAALLASVSHDLRTPLVSITGALTALRELSQRIPAEDRNRLLGSAIGEAQRLNRLIQNLLDMTRLSHGALTLRTGPVDVRDAVSQAISQLDSVLAAYEVDVRIPATLPPAYVDATLLGQVLANLLENAAKFAPAGTAIRVDARATADAIEMTVSDRGPGIAESERHKVFDLFYRAGQRDNGTAGAGMGLAISKGFVEAMGGTIGIADSAEGTVVEIQLPRSDIPAHAGIEVLENGFPRSRE